MHRKPYTAKTLTGAQAAVRRLQRLVDEQSRLLQQYHEERKLLARLAAKGPAFDNPLVAFEAERVRDAVLRQLNLRPDGRPLS